MSTEGSKEQMAYMEAKKQYLAIGKRYSALLRKIMDLNPDILKQAEEILVIGEGLSVHDNRFLTTFYNDLKSKSKIDKQYYEYLTELKKIKNELDISVHNLSRSRIAYLLRKAGIPPRKVNYSKDIVATQINNKEISLLEKISLPGILDVQSSESLDELVSSGEITCQNGTLIPNTKPARDFVKKLESSIRQNFNDNYLASSGDILKQFSNADTMGLLEFIRMSADKEHIREIERKIDAGEISLSGGTLIPLNERGDKYLSLLVEELSGQLHKKVKSQLTNKNDIYVSLDPRLNKVKKSLNDFDIFVDKHNFIGRLTPENKVYADLLNRASDHKSSISKLFTDVMVLQETISASFADIKKQLISVVGKSSPDIDKILTLLVSVRYLSLYENKYENKLIELENILGIINSGQKILGPDTLARLHENLGEGISEPDVSDQIKALVLGRLTNRRELGPEMNQILVDSMLKSSLVREYKNILRSEEVIKKHISDILYNHDCLYSGLENMSEVLAELAEIDIAKKEKLADIVHELELAHKELWLSKITNNNKKLIEDVYPDLPAVTREKATNASRDAVASARREIGETFAKYRSDHKEHSDMFARELRKSLTELSKGGDIAKISAELKAKYRELNVNHDKLVSAMEKDIIALEKRLIDFEEKSPGKLEKFLISDIRATI